jgi:HlyD family secretion protein
VRPGFTCTAEITTGTRAQAIGVPIQAVTVRERVVDAGGQIIPPSPTTGTSTRLAVPQELEPGQTRKEFEGVFAVRDGRAAFVPIQTGIVGDRYFEVLDGLEGGDEVITGPFASVRDLREGDAVRTTAAPATSTSPTAR